MAEFYIYFLMGDINVGNATFIQGNLHVFNNMASQKDKTERTEIVADAEEVTDSKPTADDRPANVGHESSNQQQTVAKTAEKPSCSIPQDCRDAVDKVLTREFLAKPPKAQSVSQRFNSRQAIIRASAVINLGKKAEIAKLMAVGKELGAVMSSAFPTNFVRALIGLGIIAYTNEEEFGRITDGVGRKLKTLGTKYREWSSDRDRETAKSIHEAMTRQDESYSG